jgi:hypothetical protein
MCKAKFMVVRQRALQLSEYGHVVSDIVPIVGALVIIL